MKKPIKPRAPGARDQARPARAPAGARARPVPGYSAARARPAATGGYAAGPRARPPRDYAAPPERARPPRAEETADERGRGGPRPPRAGFTVTLDPDVARVFRGDASVNKALRLVIQMVQVVEGPVAAAPRAFEPRTDAAPPRRAGGYQGSPEARGFTRKPRFAEDES